MSADWKTTIQRGHCASAQPPAARCKGRPDLILTPTGLLLRQVGKTSHGAKTALPPVPSHDGLRLSRRRDGKTAP